MLATSSRRLVLILHQIGLVEHRDHRLVARAQLFQHFLHGLHLHVAMRMAGIHDVNQEVRLNGLFQRGAEGGDKMGGQIANEAYRIGQQHGPAVGQNHAARGRVERGEQFRVGKNFAPESVLSRVDLPALV